MQRRDRAFREKPAFQQAILSLIEFIAGGGLLGLEAVGWPVQDLGGFSVDLQRDASAITWGEQKRVSRANGQNGREDSRDDQAILPKDLYIFG